MVEHTTLTRDILVQFQLRVLAEGHKTRKGETMRFKHDEVDRYGGQGGSGYFSLKDDGDVATVRFMYNGIEDVEGYAVHEVEVDGKKRWVNCIREYNSPVDECPFCAEKHFQTAKLFIPIYNVDEEKVQIWERGKTFFQKMSSICARYSNTDVPLVAQEFEIERNGKKGSTSTRYEIYPVGQPDSTRIEDLPEMPAILGGLILDKTYEEMSEYLETGEFPSDEPVLQRRGRRDEEPVRNTSDRRPASTEDRRRNTERRTPRKRGDEF